MAAKLMGHKVVVWLPEEERWRGGYLLGLVPVDDVFVIKWSRKGPLRNLKGIWRVHSPSLFTGTNLLPIPKHPAKLPTAKKTGGRYTSENHPYKGVFGEAHPAWKGGGSDPSYQRAKTRKMFRAYAPTECEIEGCSNKPTIHHKDGDNTNNDIENIQFLCNKHHTQLHGLQRVNERIRDKKGKYMATKRATKASSSTTKRTATKKAASTDENGAKKTTGRTRGPDKLEGLSDARKRNIAKLIFRERSKSPSTSWPDITQLIEDKYDWSLPGSMTGRRLLREFGPDNAEDAIIKQDRSGAKKATTKKAAAKKGTAKKKAPEPEDVEDEEEDEDLEDEEDEELEDEEELDEDDEDEDEDEEDEDEEEDEPEPAPAAKSKRVAVKRGSRSKKS